MPIDKKEYFWLKNGKPLKSITELSQALKDMPKEMYDHHVNKDNNDFSNWIFHVFKGNQLAKSIRDAKTPEEMHKKIYNFLHPKKTESKKILVKKEKRTIRNKKVKKRKKIIPKNKNSSNKKIKAQTSNKKERERKTKNKPKIEIYSKDNKKNSNLAEHSIIYKEFFKDNIKEDNNENNFYIKFVKYGIIEFLVGICIGVIGIIIIKGWI